MRFDPTCSGRELALKDGNEFLLGLYRDARECSLDEFQSAALASLQTHFPFSSAIWIDGRLIDHDAAVVPTAIHAQHIDQRFLVDWSRAHHADPALPLLISQWGRALRIRVPSFYAATPELATLWAEQDIGSMTAIVVPGLRASDIHWLSLFRADADDFCFETEQHWLECTMPHLTEALRVNRALHGPVGTGDHVIQGHVAVAEARSGRLLRADSGFLAMLRREWPGFDGRCVPAVLMSHWLTSQAHGNLMFAHLARKVRIDGRRVGELVFLSAQAKTGSESLTPRQRGIAELYTQGLSHKEIAQRCSLSPATVRNHLALIYAALGVHGKLELANLLHNLASEAMRPATALPNGTRLVTRNVGDVEAASLRSR